MKDLSNITEEILEIFKKSLPKKNRDIEIGLDDEMKNFGLDSIGFLELLLALENKFELDLSDNVNELKNVLTPKNLVDLVKSKIK